METRNPEPQRPFRRTDTAILIVGLCLATLLGAIDQTIGATAIPTIAKDLKSDYVYTWVGAAFLLANAAASPLWVGTSHSLGLRPLFYSSVTIFSAGNLVTGFANSAAILITGRAIAGSGAGGIVTAVSITISKRFSIRRRAAVFGATGMMWVFASGCGPVIGGVFSERISWRWVFWSNPPIAAIALAMITLSPQVPKSDSSNIAGFRQMDYIGLILATGGTAMLLTGMQLGGTAAPWSSAEVICLLVLGAMLIAAFALFEHRRTASPLIPGRIVRSRNNAASLAVCFFHGIVFMANNYYLPLYLQSVKALNPEQSGLWLLPFVVALALLLLVAAYVINTWGSHVVLMYAGLVFMSLGSGLYIDFDRETSYTKIAIYQVISGIGAGLNFVAPLLALQAGSAETDTAVATATYGFVRNVSTTTSVIVGSAVIQNSIQNQVHKLSKSIGPSVANMFSGKHFASNVVSIPDFSAADAAAIEDSFAYAMRRLWILLFAFSVCGLIVASAVKRAVLKDSRESGAERPQSYSGAKLQLSASEQLDLSGVEVSAGVVPSVAENEEKVAGHDSHRPETRLA